jgi:Leucine-rich repeat (LRR) protein
VIGLSGSEHVVDAWPGDVIGLVGMGYLYRGEPRLECSFDGTVLTVNGREVGVTLDTGRIDEALVVRHRRSASTIVVRGRGEIDPATIAAVEALAADEVLLELRWEGEVAPRLERLVGLGTRLRALALHGVAAGPESLRGLQRFPALETVAIFARAFTDGDLQNVAAPPGLRHLMLPTSNSVSDAGLSHVERFPDLESLDLGGAHVTDASLAHIARLSRLRALFLAGTGITDAGLAQLAGLSRLRALSLYSTQVTDAGAAHLAGLTRLRVLGLAYTAIGDPAMAHVAGLAQLRSLDLEGTQVGDAGIVYVAGLAWLRTLDLENTKVGDAGARRLEGLAQLRDLDLERTRVGEAAVRRLLARLPECDVVLP